MRQPCKIPEHRWVIRYVHVILGVDVTFGTRRSEDSGVSQVGQLK